MDGFFVLRFPLFSFAEFAALGDDNVVARIRALCADPRFRESLFLASPGLDESVQRWEELTKARAHQLVATLYKYLSRMTTRPAPFGTFAGYSVGRIAHETDFITTFDANLDERVVELSPSWLRRVIDSQSRQVRASSRWHRNPTARCAADGIRYIERHIDGGSYSYALSEVEGSPLIRSALDAATGVPLDEIARVVMNVDSEVAKDEARQFVEQLIDAQLLVSDFELPLSSLDPADDAVRLLRQHGLADLAAAIEEAAAALAKMSEEPLGVSPASYRRIAAKLESATRTDPTRIFNAKLMRSGTPEIGSGVIAEIDRAVALLQEIRRPEKTPLQTFAEEFSRRFGTREVLLLEALDPESGISFPPVVPDSSPLIEGLPFRPPFSEESSEWLHRDGILLNLVHDCLRAGRNEIALTDDDVSRLAGRGEPLPLPDTFAVQASIAARGQDKLRGGDFRVIIEGVAGPSAARLFTRFCSTDPVLLEHVRQHVEEEERCRPDAVFAEVLHLPEGLHAVMASRPAVRAYEIPLLAASSLPREQQIPLDDLLVSVDGDSVLLRSRRLGREVIPRLTTALNLEHARGIALFRFFGALTRQGRACTLYWDWGRLSAAAHLPRVTAGRVVLARESWRVTAEEVDAVSGSDERIVAWCRERKLPRFVRIAGELTVDLSTEIGRATLVDSARRGAVLTEFLPEPESLWFGGDQPFVHEILVPYVSTAEPVRARSRRPSAEIGQRVFVPGSEWLYAKLYTGPSTTDRLLVGPIRELVEQLREDAVIDRWFFIRYADPDWHLRLRFHGPAGALTTVALPKLHAAVAPHVEAGMISRIELATYDREVERYGGGEGIDLAEAIFHVDSEMVIEALSATGGDDTERWHCAVAGVDRLLDDFGCSLEAKRNIVQNLRMTGSTRFEVDKRLVRALGDRFRALRTEVEAAMKDAATNPAFRRRSQRLAPLVEELRRREAQGSLSTSVAAMAGNFVHMFLNRLFRGAQTQHEFVVCDFLDRAYESAVMRSRSEEQRSAPATK